MTNTWRTVHNRTTATSCGGMQLEQTYDHSEQEMGAERR